MVQQPENSFYFVYRLESRRSAYLRSKRRKRAKGQSWIKRVVAEMGGKDAIIVGDEADLDSAASGVVAGGVRFSGTKMFGLFALDCGRKSSR